MVEQLSPEQYALARPIFAPLRYHLMVDSVIDGITPGRIYVDRIQHPQAALMWDGFGWLLLSGDHNQPGAISEFRQILHTQILPDAITNQVRNISVHYSPSTWDSGIEDITAGVPCVSANRRFYVSSKQKLDWRAHLPDGFELVLIDHGLLRDQKTHNISELVQSIDRRWGSLESYLEHGWGYVLTERDSAVCWCFTAYASRGHYEFFIETIPQHKRQGYATLVAAACVEQCMDRGWTPHWHCWEHDLASIRIAQKIGFEIPMRYPVIRLHIAENE